MGLNNSEIIELFLNWFHNAHYIYRWFWLIIILEFLFLGAIWIVVLFFRFVKTYFDNKSAEWTENFSAQILLALQNGTKFVVINNLEYHRRFKSILKIIEAFDMKVDSKEWSLVRSDLIKTFLLPKVNRYAKKYNWVKRNLAIRILSLNPDIYYENTINKLLSDTVPLIKFQATRCAVAVGSDKLLNSVMQILVQESRFARYVYLDAIQRAGAHVNIWVQKYYKNQKEPRNRKACLDILSGQTFSDLTSEISNDLNSEHMELKISAIKLLGKTPLPQTAQKLINLMKEPAWQVRSNAASSLGNLSDKNALGVLAKGLRDSNWWVRLNSALSLKKYGQEGVTVLKKQDKDIDAYAFEMAKYVLSLNV